MFFLLVIKPFSLASCELLIYATSIKHDDSRGHFLSKTLTVGSNNTDMDGLSRDPSHWWRDQRLTKCPMPMPQLLTSRSPPNYTFLWLRFMGTYISRGVCTQQVLTNGFLYFTEFRKSPKYVTSTWVLKTRLIEKKIPIIFFSSQIFGNCKTIPKM